MILEIVQRDTPLKRTASTNGGEYHGPCVSCGGRDRFTLWPNEGQTGRYWCRQCGISGDGIDYLRKIKGLSFPAACAELKYTPQETSTRDVLNKPINIPRLKPPQHRVWEEGFDYEVKLHTLPQEHRPDEVITPVDHIESDPVIEAIEAETAPDNNGDTVTARPRAQYIFDTDIGDIQRLGCKDCDYLHGLSCAGGKYARLIGLMETCPRDGIRG